MKKFILISVAMFLSISLFGQEQKPIEFMGIPVDGTVANMESKLIAKGFKYDATLDGYIGEFNGEDVEIYILSNKGKVWRVAVLYYITEEAALAKLIFNSLYDSFNSSSKYVMITEDAKIESSVPPYRLAMMAKNLEIEFYAFPSFLRTNYVSVTLLYDSGEYTIVLCYTNTDNAPNGEDL